MEPSYFWMAAHLIPFIPVPQNVWRINLDLPDESKEVSLDNTDERWWEQVDLTKLILASNALTSLSEDIKELPALTVLDVRKPVTRRDLWPLLL